MASFRVTCEVSWLLNLEPDMANAGQHFKHTFPSKVKGTTTTSQNSQVAPGFLIFRG